MTHTLLNVNSEAQQRKAARIRFKMRKTKSIMMKIFYKLSCLRSQYNIEQRNDTQKTYRAFMELG